MPETKTKKETPHIEIVETVDGVAGSEAPIRKSVRGKAAPRSLKNDKFIWGIYIFLILFSVIELYSASSSEIKSANVYYPLIRHCTFLAVGLGIMILFQRIHYGYFARFAWPFGILSLGLLVLSMVAGVTINDAQRAIKIAGMTIQPAEIVKLAVVVLLANILGKNQRPRGVTNKGIFLSALVVIVFSALLYKNGFTNMVLMMGTSVAMFLIGGIPMRKFFAIILIYGVCAGGMWAIKKANSGPSEFEKVQQAETLVASDPNLKINNPAALNAKAGGREETRDNRVERWWQGVHPNDSINDYNRQEMMARFSLANGGLTGKGPGNSRESSRLPLAFSDYIFSILVEDTGFIGGAALLLLYLGLIGRAGAVAYKCTRAFPAFLILGCAVMIVLQALGHMAIVTGLVPVSGQPLPFISKGGTSILVMSAALGIMLSVSRFAVKSGSTTKSADMRDENKNLPADLRSLNMTSYEDKGTKR